MRTNKENTLGLYITKPDFKRDNYVGGLGGDFVGTFVNVDQEMKITNVINSYDQPFRPLAGLEIKSHHYTSKYSNGDHPSNHYEAIYLDAYQPGLEDLERAAKSLRTIEKKMNLLNSKRGYPIDFADYMGRFAEVSGCEYIIFKVSGYGWQYSDHEHRFRTIGEGIDELRHILAIDKAWQDEITETAQRATAA